MHAAYSISATRAGHAPRNYPPRMGVNSHCSLPECSCDIAAPPAPQAAVIEVVEVEVPVEGCGPTVDRVDEDCPGPELLAASHTAPQGVNQQVSPDTVTQPGPVHREPCQEHNGKRVGHPPSKTGRRCCVHHRTHDHGVVSDDPVASTQDIGRRRTSGARDLGGVAQLAIDLGDPGAEVATQGRPGILRLMRGAIDVVSFVDLATTPHPSQSPRVSPVSARIVRSGQCLKPSATSDVRFT